MNSRTRLCSGWDRSFHSELPGDRLNAPPSPFGALFRERDTDSHEEALARDLIHLRGFDDVAAVFEQAARDIGDDSGNIAARQGQDVLRFQYILGVYQQTISRGHGRSVPVAPTWVSGCLKSERWTEEERREACAVTRLRL